MASDNKNNKVEKPIVDEAYLMDIISGNEQSSSNESDQEKEIKTENKPREKYRLSSSKKLNYEDTFLINRFPSGRSGKVVYIRPEYHERLLRIVQLTREEKTTLYSYIDNILDHHFREFGDDITNYFNDRFKPIL